MTGQRLIPPRTDRDEHKPTKKFKKHLSLNHIYDNNGKKNEFR